jgi:hypothetical protein
MNRQNRAWGMGRGTRVGNQAPSFWLTAVTRVSWLARSRNAPLARAPSPTPRALSTGVQP